MRDKSDNTEYVDPKKDIEILVKDILDLKGSEIHSIRSSELLPRAVEKMVKNDIGSLIVYNHDSVVGQLTFREVLTALNNTKGDIKATKVLDVMVTDVTFGHPDDTMKHVKHLMIEKRVRYLPIIDNKKLLGIMSFRDIARAILNLANYENSMLRKYIKTWPVE